MTEKTNRPVDTLRFGALTATIWRNETEAGHRYNTTIERRYQDDDGNWHSTNSFGRDHLLLLAKLADRAHTRIYELVAEERARAEARSNGQASGLTGARQQKARKMER